MCIPDLLLDNIDFALTLKDREKLIDAIESIISELNNLQVKEDNIEVNYLLGYCWYLHPNRQFSKEIENKVNENLLKVINQDPNHALAWLYLGHNAYDFCLYEIAFERFSKVKLESISSYLQMKTQEMILCCKINLYGLHKSLTDLEDFVNLAENSESVDLWPQELARTLPNFINGFNRSDSDQLKRLFERLDAAGNFGNWFSEITSGDF